MTAQVERRCSLKEGVHVACSHLDPPPRRPSGRCRRGLHDLTVEGSKTEDGHCRECKRRGEEARRAGRVRYHASGAAYNEGRYPLGPERLAYLRSLIPCMGCGAVLEERPSGAVRTRHRRGCATAFIREG